MADEPVFASVSAALAADFRVFDRDERGLIVRRATAAGWEFGRVVFASEP